jgi:hypothetical protein
MRASVLALCALVCAALAGCGGRGGPTATDLTFLALNPNVGRAAFHLRCAPPGGDLARPAKACAALAAQPDLVTAPKPFVCIGGTFSWWDVTITGRLRGRPVQTRTSTCWTPQMATIRRLGMGFSSLRAHLLPRHRETVLPGAPHTFAPGLLRPADLIKCSILGHRLEQGVPLTPGTASTGYGGKHTTSVTLEVTLGRDGSVTASCRRARS